MGKFSRLGNELYTGRKSYDFVGRRPLWYAITGVIVLAAIAAILIRGLNFGIEFTGGNEFRVPVSGGATQQVADDYGKVVAETGVAGAESPTVTTAGNAVLIQVEDMPQADVQAIKDALVKAAGVSPDDVSNSDIGASWGEAVAKRAALGVGVFLVLVLIFIALYFREWKMSVAAFVALAHDVVITVGVYALSGFQVTPAAVTGLLAILGFSLYDTVVVFDKVRENTHEMRKNRQTYAQAANLAVNQTLVRSINTGIVALIPIGAILWVSAAQLGASSLQDLALSQFVGMAVGVYSSVILAPRVLVQLKSNEDEVKLAERRAKARARAQVDRYASVPSFTEDMPVGRDPDGEEDEEIEIEVVTDDVESTPSSGRPTLTKPDSSATGRGRTVPPARGPVSRSASSGRNQPSRQSKSKRGK
ncbi:protein translocase subunit SecF [Nocardioides sp. GXZ039]|uniref:protein translocase subunit SecF n=1 Tax=Nocardioides sp. GXZ039 TaxID=3136018 RepID=UPI0030F3B7FE